MVLKRRLGAQRKVRHGVTMKGCPRGLGESIPRAARAEARLWWAGNKWEVRDWGPFADFPSKEAGCEGETYGGS